jgi:AcrR family transcriptional regulator
MARDLTAAGTVSYDRTRVTQGYPGCETLMNTKPPAIAAPMSAAAAAIADATIGVIASDGFDKVSVRSVAKAAGVAPGTVQHHFRSRDDLLVGALRRTVRRQLERLAPSPPGLHPSERLLLGLMELLPIEATPREEAIVWVAFSSAASTRPSLRESHAAAVQLTRSVIRDVLEAASTSHQLRPGITVDVGSAMLTAVIDGLIVDGINAPAADAPLLVATLKQAIDLVVVPPEEA